jgi:cytochrome P450 family 4
VLGNRQQITYQDAMSLKYSSSIFKEALRLYPPSPLLLRRNTQEMISQGYKIPVNSIVSVSSYVSGRYENFFPEPLKFRPERFSKDVDTMETWLVGLISLFSLNNVAF